MKKLSIMIMALALVLGMAQCKKQTEQQANEPAGATMDVTVRVQGNTEKTDITSTGVVTWKQGDKLYVVGESQGLLGYVSARADGDPATFSGTITALTSAQTLRFYYVGDKSFTLNGDNYTFDLGSQDGSLAGIAAHSQLMWGKTTGTIAVGAIDFGTITMTSLMSIAHLSIKDGGAAVSGPVAVTGGFATSTFNAKTYDGTTLTGTAGNITMTFAAGTASTNCYLALLPGTQTLKLTDAGGGKVAKLSEKAVAPNMFYNSGTAIAVSVTEPIKPSTVTVTAGCVSCTYSVGGTVTVPSGSHTCEYGLVYCPTSAGHMPTVADSKIVVNTETFSGTKDFTADLGVLEVGVEYKVRAYAMIEGVAYSSESTVKTVTGGNVPQAMTWTGGKSPKKFYVSATKKVYFSQGNLQYIGSAATPYWKFADHQFDFLGNNGQGSTSETADRDLFGWGDLTGCKTSTRDADYTWTNDWGTEIGIGWRTLTKDEWMYLINARMDGSGNLLYGEGMVGSCTPGLIILPDEWRWEGDVAEFEESWTPGKSSWKNVYSYSQWAKMEAAGAVFLPVTGNRNGTSLSGVGSNGYYWSSSYNGTKNAYCIGFIYANVTPDSDYTRHRGFSVRLVSED